MRCDTNEGEGDSLLLFLRSEGEERTNTFRSYQGKFDNKRGKFCKIQLLIFYMYDILYIVCKRPNTIQ